MKSVLKGNPSHAGLDPDKGVSAIVALSDIVQQLVKLNDPEEGMYGLPACLNKEDPANIRVYFGIGKDTSGLYLQFGKAYKRFDLMKNK